MFEEHNNLNIEVGKYSKRSFVSLSINYKDEHEINFDGGGYKTAHIMQAGNEIFTEVNDFLTTLPQEDQYRIYDCYARVSSLLDDYNSDSDVSDEEVNDMESILQEIVKEIYDVITFERLQGYIESNSRLRVPPELSETYDTDDKVTPLYVARTYKLSEYKDLMALCLGLRFMIPIWGPYINIAKSAVGVNLKEYYAYNLIKTSTLYKSDAIERMTIYVTANVDNKDLTMSSVLNFLSDDEIPIFAMAITIIRKLALAPISFDKDRYHLMSILYNYATSKVRGLGNSLEPGLRDKPNYGMFEDDNSSVFCVYRMKEQIAAGDMTVFESYITKSEDMAKHIDPTIDLNKLKLCMDNVFSLKSWRVLEIQKSLIAWVVSEAIVGSITYSLNRKYLLMEAAVSQAILWHWGFYELALLATAKQKSNDITEYHLAKGKQRLSDQTLEKFNELYPYKMPLQKDIPGGWSDDSGVRGVELFNQEFAASDWWVQAPKELAKMYDNSHVTKYMETSPELRNHLANLLIRIHTGS